MPTTGWRASTSTSPSCAAAERGALGESSLDAAESAHYSWSRLKHSNRARVPRFFRAAPLCAFALLGAAASASCFGHSHTEVTAMPAASEKTLSSFELRGLDGTPAPLSAHAGKVVLIVNTASECGLTPQYAGLEALWREYKSRGLVVLGMPSNDFGGQEPGSSEQIQKFCTDRYQVSFPLHEKSVTKAGPDQAPLYAWLGASTGKLPGWNFSKYLIGRDGRPIEFYAHKVAPDAPELRAAIEAALAKPAQS